MSAHWHFRRARSGDLPAIMRIFKLGWPIQVRNCLPLGSRGAARFVALSLSSYGDARWFVLERNGTVGGWCEVRVSPRALTLNQIAVHPRFQGAGLGKQLLASSLRAAATERTTEVLLDVFDYSRAARTWYEHLGFKPLSVTSWASFQLSGAPDREAARRTVVHGYPQAQIVQRAFGFSEFTLLTDLGEYRVGRINSDRYRSGTPGILDDCDAMFVLRALNSKRRLLILQSPVGKWVQHHGLKRLWNSSRLGTSWIELRAHLSSK